MDIVNERSSWFTKVDFVDENGDPAVPTSASYRIDDLDSGEEVRGDTEIAPLDASVEIAWTPSDTSILDESKPYETRRMTVSWEYGASGHDNAEYYLNIKNLHGVTTPSPA